MEGTNSNFENENINEQKIQNEIKDININESLIIEKEGCSITNANPTTKNEINELYLNESSMCKIKFKGRNENKGGYGTGFFCEINDDSIPFKKALFTNNHILNEDNINKEIEIEYLNEVKRIIITNKRKIYTNKILDYTCIEIYDKDKINNYFRIDKTYFDNINILKNKEIFILQYPNGGELSHSLGKIINISNNIIIHSASTLYGSSGSPIIKRYNINMVLGIHFGELKDKYNHYKSNLATPFNIIINDIKNKVNNLNKLLNNNIEYNNKINLIYYKTNNEDKYNYIFGEKFVEKNKDNINLIINGKENDLISEYNLNIGANNIQIIVKNNLSNLEYMFCRCISLTNIDGLKYLNTKKVNNFSYTFFGCSSLLDVNALEYWNVSNGKDFKCMFAECSSLSNINALNNWNVSNGKDFSCMFINCSSLSNISSLKNWNVSNGDNFRFMFSGCSLSDLNALRYWNVSNGKDLSFLETLQFNNGPFITLNDVNNNYYGEIYKLKNKENNNNINKRNNTPMNKNFQNNVQNVQNVQNPQNVNNINSFNGKTYNNNMRRGDKNKVISPRKNTPSPAFKSIKEEFPFHKGIALRYVGATCYMNATLQCLCNIEKLVNYFKYHKNVENYIRNQGKSTLTYSFKYLIENLWQSNGSKYIIPQCNGEYYSSMQWKKY